MRVSIRVRVGRALPQLAAFTPRVEDAGCDGTGVDNHPLIGRDTYLALALAAQATERLPLIPATSSPVPLHPLVLASCAHSIVEVAPKRTVLTVARGDISTRRIVRPHANLAMTCEAIGDPRRLLAGEETTFGPAATRLHDHCAAPTPAYLPPAGPRLIIPARKSPPVPSCSSALIPRRSAPRRCICTRVSNLPVAGWTISP